MRASICLLAVVSICSPLHALAQVAASPGDRVRQQSRDRVVLVGVISAVTSESIVVRQSATGQEVVIPLSETAGLERSLGSRRSFGRYLWATIGVSALTGGVAYAVTWSPCKNVGFFGCFLEPESRTGAFGWGLAGGTLVGLPLGVIVGLVFKSEQWEPLAVPGTGDATVSITPIVGSRFGVVGSISLGGR